MYRVTSNKTILSISLSYTAIPSVIFVQCNKIIVS